MKMTRLVRYADDLVVLCRYNVHKTFGRMTEVLRKPGTHPQCRENKNRQCDG